MDILIVDDEPIIRQWFRMIIDKLEGPYRVAGEAGNGEEALQFCGKHKVDLVVTDIKMPVMDGLELLRHLKSRHSRIRGLILSSFNDFRLASEAIKAEAVDYILKAEVTAESLERILNKVQADMELERRRAMAEQQSRHVLNDNRYALRSVYFKEWMTGSGRSVQEWKGKLELLNLRLSPNNLTLIVLGAVGESQGTAKIKEAQLLEHSVINIADETILEELGGGCCFRYDAETYVILLNMDNRNSKSRREALQFAGSRVAANLKKYLNLEISVGISLTHSGFEMLPEQFREAMLALDQTMFYGQGSVILYQDLNASASPQDMGGSFQAYREKLSEMLELGDEDGFRGEVDRLFQDLEVRKPLSGSQVKTICLEVYFLLSLRARKISAGGTEAEAYTGDPLTEVNGLRTLAEAKVWLIGRVDELLRRLFRNRGRSEAIQIACDYVCRHYHEDISLRQISDYVHLNKSYFCELFKKETGMGFNEYVTQTRIERAKALIGQSNMKIGDLAERVGFANASYFSRIFAKIAGLTPNQYKENLKGRP